MKRGRRLAPGRAMLSALADGDAATYAEVSARYGIPIATLRWYVHARLIPHYRLSSRGVRFSWQQLAAWFADRAVEPLVEEAS